MRMSLAYLAIAVCVAACSPESEPGSTASPASAERDERPRVAVEPVVEETWRWTAQREAIVEPRVVRELRAPFAGVATALADPDDPAAENLLRIVASEDAARVRSLRQQLAAEDELMGRYTSLREQGVLLEEEWQDARRARDAARSAHDTELARSADRRIRRPDGTRLVRWQVSEGATVHAGDLLGWLVDAESPVARLNLSPLEVDPWQDAEHLVACARGESAPSATRIDGPAAADRSWQIELALDEQHPCARTGTRVTVRARAPEATALWRVPPRAVAHDDDASWVMRVSPDGTLERIDVAVDRALDAGLGVRGALDQGDLVLREAPRTWDEGTEVRPWQAQ